MTAFDTSRTHFGSLSTAGLIGTTFTSMFGLNNVTNTTPANAISVDLSERVGLSFSAMIATLRAWNDARSTRNALNSLSERELNDIGLSRGDIDLVARGTYTR
ncbi:MAG: DUF1127 domain-containing protein [Rhodobacteraceae bacterium]|nr:DUF1127 domain-containing protein [Paracoccaceae bacterium]